MEHSYNVRNVIIVIAFIFAILVVVIFRVMNSLSEEKICSSGSEFLEVNMEKQEIISWYLNPTNNEDIFQNDYSAWEEDSRFINNDIQIVLSTKNRREHRASTIAILDTDVDIYDSINNEHIWRNEKEIPNDKIDNAGNEYIDDYYGWNFCDNDNLLFDYSDYGEHGTYIASILVGQDKRNNFEGLIFNNNVNVMCLKVLHGKEQQGNVDSIVDAISYAEMMGANIVCLSLTSMVDYPQLRDKIKESKMLFVVAAGNYGYELGNPHYCYPACYNFDNIVTVADMRCDGRLSKTSNYSDEYVDLAAPGSNIVGMLYRNRFAYLCGTSSACVIVAGISAIIRNRSEEQLSAYDLKTAIMNNVKECTFLNGKVVMNGYIQLK